MDFIHIVLTIFTALDVAVWALWRFLARKIWHAATWPTRVLFHGFFAMQLGFVALVLRALHGGTTPHFSTPLLYLVYLWHLLLAPLFLVACVMGLTGSGVLSLFRWARPRAEKETSPADGSCVSRRQFLGTVAALAPPLLAGSVSLFAARQSSNFRIRRLTVRLHDLPEALEGMTIAHLSDLHVGPFTSPEFLLEVINGVNGLKADLNVFTGDLINNDPEYMLRAIKTLRAIQPEIVAIKGNHDQDTRRFSFAENLRAGGICLLIDETVTQTIRGVPVQLLGLRWDGPQNWQDRGDERRLQVSVDELLKQRNPAAYPILLAHHPHAWDYCGDIALTLSGHTHGGQLMLNEDHGFGPAMFRYWTGLYRRPIGPGQPNQTLVVSNGIGNWFPLRVNAPAEIVHLTLRRG
ncbi:MAG: metallophosphoesterase [Chthoniobacteraceae bacterium]